jgi:hypothetical protein
MNHTVATKPVIFTPWRELWVRPVAEERTTKFLRHFTLYHEVWRITLHMNGRKPTLKVGMTRKWL